MYPSEEDRIRIRRLTDALAAYTPSDEAERLAVPRLLAGLSASPETVFTRNNTQEHFTASAWIVNPSRDKILMVFHNLFRAWSWTGGHADGETDLLAVAIREASEESGLTRLTPVTEDIFSVEVLHIPPHEKHGRPVAPHVHLNCTYLLEADDTEPLRVKPDENSAVAWFPTEAGIAASTEPEMQVIYCKLAAKAERFRPPRRDNP